MGHVVAGWLASRHHAVVNLLTNRPEKWAHKIIVDTPEKGLLHAPLHVISANPAEVIPMSDVVLLCLPGFLIRSELQKLKPHLSPHTFVGCVFSSTGFFFEAHEVLRSNQPLWGFQRVPFISRVNVYGQSAHLLGYKQAHNVAIEHVSNSEKEAFAQMLSEWFERPINVLNNFYEASLTNSNPLLHTSRLYTLFGGAHEGKPFPRMIMFYEEWTTEAADLYIKMDEEFFQLLKVLPVSDHFLPTALHYYESHDAKSLAAKLSSIQSFKGITSPMKQTEEGWLPDFTSRYFTEDFPYGLKYIWKLAHEKGVSCPHIDKVYAWGMSKINI